MTEWLDNSNNANCFKSMYVSGFVDVSGTIISREPTLGLVLSGDASFNAGLSVSGDTSFNKLQVATASRVGGIKIGSNLAITDDGTLSISDDLSLNGRLFVSEDASLNGDLYVSGNIQVEDLTLNDTYTFSKNINNDLLISRYDASVNSVILSNTWNATNNTDTNRGTNLQLDGDIIIKPNSNDASLNSQMSNIQLWATFHEHPDGGVRRAADITSGFADASTNPVFATGTWSNEYISFGVGGATDSNSATTEQMRITTVGVGIGTTAPQYTLDVSGTIRSTAVKIGTSTISNVPGITDGFFFNCEGGGGFSVNVGTINGIWIDPDGQTFIGDASLNANISIRSTQGGVYLTGYTSAGDVITTGSVGQLTISSDIRLKKNIVEYNEPSMEKIMKLKPSYYEWISEKSSGQTELGFIAQDVETVIPEAVDGKKYEYEWKRDEYGEPILDANGDLQFSDVPRYRGFKTRPVVCVMVKAMQEQQAHIQAQADTIQAILGRLDNAGI